MKPSIVVDASVAVKWVVKEEGSDVALRLPEFFQPVVPDLMFAECANILWKKFGRGFLTEVEALDAAHLLEATELDVRPLQSLAFQATTLSLQLNNAAYDCFYLALAQQERCSFVTEDKSFRDKVRQHVPIEAGRCVPLAAFT